MPGLAAQQHLLYREHPVARIRSLQEVCQDQSVHRRPDLIGRDAGNCCKLLFALRWIGCQDVVQLPVQILLFHPYTFRRVVNKSFCYAIRAYGYMDSERPTDIHG